MKKSVADSMATTRTTVTLSQLWKDFDQPTSDSVYVEDNSYLPWSSGDATKTSSTSVPAEKEGEEQAGLLKLQWEEDEEEDWYNQPFSNDDDSWSEHYDTSTDTKADSWSEQYVPITSNEAHCADDEEKEKTQEPAVCLDDQTDDEFIPFEHYVVSRFGPISRTSKTRARDSGPMQVMARQHKGTTPVTAVTPMTRPQPICSQVPSQFAASGQALVAETDNKADPQGHHVAYSLPNVVPGPGRKPLSCMLWTLKEKLRIVTEC
eukprot:GHVU01136919.1.p2 GENE.GHVU01136919.1~~GHVU01136919.1.p2  ORF type:complete len:263 (-),score=43.80 GHVU01136919.1:410-1198(-)